MNDDTGDSRDRRRAWPRRAGVLAVMAGIAVLAAACSGGSSTSTTGSTGGTGGSTTYQKALAYSQCMRSHGVPNFPDPNSNGAIAFNAQKGTSGNLNSPRMQSADKACRHLLPNGGQTSAPQQQQQILSQLLKFSQCMRSHGVPNFPDPTVSNGMIELRRGGRGVNPQSPQFQSAQRACQSLMPAASGS